MTRPEAGRAERSTANPPGQPALSRRISTHARAMTAMRATLQHQAQPAAVRALARRPADEPAIALLDGWAVVADIVSFYTERIAQEGYLRTATELRSVRELARSLGQELGPGVAAAADLAFTVEEAVGAPTAAIVPKGSLVQSVPGQHQAPQVFETDDDLDARAAWNALAAVTTDPQVCDEATRRLWLTGTAHVLRPGDTLLAVGLDPGPERDAPTPAVLRVTGVTAAPPGHPSWTLLDLEPVTTGTLPTGDRPHGPGGSVHTFAARANLFGWNAPDAALLALTGQPSGSATEAPASGTDRYLTLDGDHPRILPGSWLVVQVGATCLPLTARQVTPSGEAHNGLSGRTTQVRIDDAVDPALFDVRTTLVHCQSAELPASVMPRTRPVAGSELELVATTDPLPPERAVIVRGTTVDGTPAAERAMVLTSTIDDTGTVMTVTLDRPLEHSYLPHTVSVLGNVVGATHGEPVHQVLGSGDGARTFHRLRTRRGPLSYRRTQATAEPASTLRISVDGAPWREVPSLAAAGPHDPVFAVRSAEDGTVEVVFGDGQYGARLPTGTENITADYRVGTGRDGDLEPGQLTLPLSRPLGISAVTNPTATRGWVPPAALADTRPDIPLRMRTLDRVVSVADHEDFVRGLAGVGAARAETVWSGHRRTVVVSVTGLGSAPLDDALLAGLDAALAAVRDPRVPLLVLTAGTLWYGLRMEVEPEPGSEWSAVRRRVTETLRQEFAAHRRPFGPPVTDSAVLAVARGVPGVASCTLPRLLRLSPGSTALPPDTAAERVIGPSPARSAAGTIRPATVLALAADRSDIRRMTP
ncbi:putative baseplate assembly protein [Streptomyces lydicus]|uniref:putative baseplate assembly protein n=1 Tax=Streptomyces lydicus TaxID=47763 RepID=UPI0005260E72|nr:putative baseplate assembly protein [Streptomyces lydicus]UEG89212.1 putative baseplate assembly protein [Streptomyces lydicus]